MRPLNRFLKMAVMAGVERAIQIHIDRGDDLNARDGSGLTLLMLSAPRNNSAICKLLLDAGADKNLLSPSGQTAHAIAIAAGAHETAAVLEPVLSRVEIFDAPAPSKVSPSGGPIVPWVDQDMECSTYVIDSDTIAAEMKFPAAQAGIEELTEPENTLGFDLFGWEPEEEGLPPEADASIAQAASAIQSAISGYEPIDSSADWEDIHAYLPERVLPLARADDSEARERLRLLLLRTVREGSVPRFQVEALSLNDDGSANFEAEALLSMVINDLGAEVDERFEYDSVHENFEVYVKPEEAPDEEEIVADALAFVGNLASRHTEPIRLYQKEFQRARLISAEEEVSLAQAMEIGLEQALDALAAWPHGIDRTLAAGHLVKTKQRPLVWLSYGLADVHPDIEFVSEGDSNDDVAIPDEETDEDVESDDDSQFGPDVLLVDHASDFMDSLRRLSSLRVDSVKGEPDWRAVRETLAALRLNRRFLVELVDVEGDGASDSAVQYCSAIKTYQNARERMTAANLKLVFHLAKKYLYSGEPLDDLAQEGNIGLLKAVERFDWRRGFKFSTYATWWIRQHIGRHVADKCRTIRVPVHIHEKVQRLSREMQASESTTGRAPELNEITTRLGMSTRTVNALQLLMSEPLPIHEILDDEQIAVDARSSFVWPDPFDIVSESELRETIGKVLSTLKPKHAQVLRLRYGIGIKDSLTLDDVGQRYGVTRERIRQIEANAIRKLKHPSRMDVLSRAFFGYAFPGEGKREEDGTGADNTEQSPDFNPMQQQSIAVNVTPECTSTPPSAKSPSMAKLLAQAAALGIPIVDDSNGVSGRIWVNFIEAHDVRYRHLVRRLDALGFVLWPGKGYYR
jgi:RNA polymerase primary sigma factor